MKALIMAGGSGTRLRPITCNIPKPMVPVANKPTMEHIINILKKNGYSEIITTLQYLPEHIKEYFGDGSDFGISIDYFIEDKPLGTAGSVKNAERLLDETFIVISGDSLTDIDLKKAMDFHNLKKSMATIVLKKVDIPLEYGVVATDTNGRITRFVEKPAWGEVISDTVNTGIYILSSDVLRYIKSNEVFDFSKDLFPLLLKQKEPLFGFITDGYWCDIGDPKAYRQVHTDILDGNVMLEINGKGENNGLWIDNTAIIEKGCEIQSPCIIGKNAHIQEGAIIGAYSVIGDNTVIAPFATIKKAIIGNNCYVGSFSELRGCVICNRCIIKKKTNIFENSIIGDSVSIGENTIIKPGIRIWPYKAIDSCTQINENIVWENTVNRMFIANSRISGIFNYDITPEFTVKTGMAFGSLFNEKDTVCIGSDHSKPSVILKSALINGLQSSGIKVFDSGTTILPAFRSMVKFFRHKGGIFVYMNIEGKIKIEFTNYDGNNIDRNTERKLESILFREDYKRCPAEYIKETDKIKGYTKFYFRRLLNENTVSGIKYKILMHSQCENVMWIIKGFLENAGLEVDIADISLIKTEKNIIYDNDKYAFCFCEYIKDNKYDFGVFFDDSNERLCLIDDKGRLLDEERYKALLSIILFKTGFKGSFLISPSSSSIMEKIAVIYNGKLLRGKSTSYSENDYIAGDVMDGLLKIAGYMALNKCGLSYLADMIPSFFRESREVECSWDTKGKVIRTIISENSEKEIETVEGVKINGEKGWVLILPDAERPVCKIISEGHSSEFAKELGAHYFNKIREMNN